MALAGGILIVLAIFALGFMTGASGMRAYIRHQIIKEAVRQRIAELDGRMPPYPERETDEHGFCLITPGSKSCRLCHPYECGS